jgi:hypothetical protein
MQHRYFEYGKIDVRIIIEWIIQIEYVGLDCIHVAQDRSQWRILVNAVMSFRGSIKAGNFLTS